MPYQGDEFFPEADERGETNREAVYRLRTMVALREVAHFLGFDAIGDFITDALDGECSDAGVDLDDRDNVIEEANGSVSSATHAARLLASDVAYEVAATEKRRERQIAQLASLRDALREGGE